MGRKKIFQSRAEKIAYWRTKRPEDWFFRQTRQLTLDGFIDHNGACKR